MKKSIHHFKLLGLLSGFLFMFSCNTENPYVDPNYSHVKVLQVKVVNMPFVDSNSASWDIGNGPDLFFEIENASGAVLVSSSKINNLQIAALPVGWTLNTALEINNFMAQYTIILYDYDTADPNDMIGGYYLPSTSLNPHILKQLPFQEVAPVLLLI